MPDRRKQKQKTQFYSVFIIHMLKGPGNCKNFPSWSFLFPPFHTGAENSMKNLQKKSFFSAPGPHPTMQLLTNYKPTQPQFQIRQSNNSQN